MEINDQMWSPEHPCGCPRGTSARCPTHLPDPGAFDVVQVTGWRPTDPQTPSVTLSDADVERIARRVAELLKAAP